MDFLGLLGTNNVVDSAQRAPDGESEARLALASMRAHVDDMSRLAAQVSTTLDAIERGTARPGSLISDIARRTVPRWHFAMLNDHERNDAFAVALERRMKPGAHVLDIGSGTGLLAMMAAQAGAAKVTTCEVNPLLAEIARQLIDAHGMSDVITVVPKMSTDLVVGRDLERPADLIVSEIVDCGLIGEGLLPTMRHARAELLAEDGRLLPEGATMFGFLIESPVVVGLNRVGLAAGYDVRLLNSVATQGHFPVRLETWPHRPLSDSVHIADFDLLDGSLADDRRRVDVPVEQNGMAHALVVWFEMNLGNGVAIRNSPENIGSHWMQALLLFDEAIPVTAGSSLRVDIGWQEERLTADVVTAAYASGISEGER